MFFIFKDGYLKPPLEKKSVIIMTAADTINNTEVISLFTEEDI